MLPGTPAPEPEMITILRRYRLAVDAREEQMVYQLAQSWLTIEQRLENEILLLSYEMERRKAAGEIVTQQMLWREARYKRLLAQLKNEVDKWNSEAASTIIAQTQRDMANLGIKAAQDALIASFTDNIISFEKINVQAVEAMIAVTRDGSALMTLLKGVYEDAASGIGEVLINGIARGLGVAQIARDIADSVSMGLDRALLIARTESARAYRTGSTEQYRKSGVVKAWRRLVKKPTACLACLLMDGDTYALESEMEDHPNGKCTVVPVVIGAPEVKWKYGKDWFLEQSEEKQRALMGDKRYTLWQDGTIKLEEVAHIKQDDVWGGSPRLVPLGEMG
jgi:hypothetical protein